MSTEIFTDEEKQEVMQLLSVMIGVSTPENDSFLMDIGFIESGTYDYFRETINAAIDKVIALGEKMNAASR